MDLIGIVGAGGLGREVAPILREITAPDGARIVFVSDEPSTRAINGFECLQTEDFFSLACENRFFNVAIGNPGIRRTVADRFLARGGLVRSIVAPTAKSLDANIVGEGAILCDYSMITANATLGRFVTLNIYSYIAHDCIIGDYVTIGPGAKINGNVHIGDGALIGAGATIMNGAPAQPIVIGAGATVGLGAVVIDSVPEGSTVVGVPARPIPRR